jgi:hypothetical protein
MRSALVFCLPLALAACVDAPARPSFVDVTQQGIAVEMSDGQTCVGMAPAPGTDWSGTLQSCNSPYPYRVVLEGGNGARTQINAALGDVLNLAAVVEIDGPAGNTWTFRTPVRVNFEEPSPRLR